jgi:hypothetical protein
LVQSTGRPDADYHLLLYLFATLSHPSYGRSPCVQRIVSRSRPSSFASPRHPITPTDHHGQAVSEAYFLHTVPHEWTFSGPRIRSRASDKAYRLLQESQGNLLFSEFGTRRRRSWETQKEVIQGLKEGEERFWKDVGGRQGKKGGLVGTSNVSWGVGTVCTRLGLVDWFGLRVCGSSLQVKLAMMFDMKPVGTIAHEWIMAVGAKRHYDRPNGTAMDLWEQGTSSRQAEVPYQRVTDPLTVFDEFRSVPLITHFSAPYHAHRHIHRQGVL